MKTGLYSLFIFSMLLFVTSCGQDNSKLMRIGTNIWPGYEPLYVAREKGWLESGNVKLIEYPSASEVIRALRNKTLEAASLTLDEVIQLSESNIPLKIVLIHDISAGADVIVAKSGISSMQGLKGKRVGVEAGALGAYMITRALEMHGMDLADVEIVNMDVNRHERAFIEGQVDAVVTFEPVRSKLLKQGGKEIFSSNEIPGEVVDVLVVHKDYLEQNRANVKKVIDIWFDALDYKQQEPEEFARVSSQRLKINVQDVMNSYAGLHLPDRLENLKLMSGEDSRLQQSLLEIRRVLQQYGLVKPGVDVENMIAPLAN